MQLPAEDFVYLADSARFPYGARTGAELERFALEVAEELIARRVKLLVVACNSATAAALPALRERLRQTTLGVDVLGVVQPGAVQAVGGDAQRPRRAARHAGDRRERLVRARDRGRRPVRAARPRSPCPDLAAIIEARLPVRPARRRHRPHLLRAAARGRRRHRRPRLHALPARAPDAPAHARPPREHHRLRRPARPPGRARARRARPGEPARRRAARATTRSCAPATRRRSATLGTRFLQLPLGEVEPVDARRARPGRGSAR